jgi:hypothetical protein
MTPDEAIARAGGWGNFLIEIIAQGKEAFPDIENRPPPLREDPGRTTMDVFVAEPISIQPK